MTRTPASLLVVAALAASCATTNTAVSVPNQPADVQLPNSTPQTAIPLPVGLEVTGSLSCGQTAWFSVILPETRVITMNVHGQALENDLGVTATLSFVEQGGAVLGSLLLPIFARSPNWDPREQQFQPPHPGGYLVRVTLDPNGCQRAAFRLILR